ncbi:MAG: hypothetical protein VX733_13410 [Candidatus Latescibacterota bacterium]|nr:hypothetical protein [Candidatus Latescibacterota bacterium]
MFKKFALTALAAVFLFPVLSHSQDDANGAAGEPHDGDGFYCQICDIHFETAAEMDEHAREAGHLEHGEHHPPEDGEPHDGDGFYCQICDIHFETAAEMDEHAREAGHLEHGQHHDMGPTFEMVDADGNEEISLEEATRFFMRDFVKECEGQAMEECEGQAMTEHKKVFKAVDKNADRIVDRAEFAAEKARQEELGPDGDYKDAEGDWQYQGGPPPEGGN